MKEEEKQSGRRNFLKLGLLAGGATLAGGKLAANLSESNEESGEKTKVLTQDGRLVEVSVESIEGSKHCGMTSKTDEQVREGMDGRKFVMVVDLARCRNALKCQEACNKNHFITGDNAWLKIYKIQESTDTAPYWLPMMCQHCDKPACVTVCPVDATFKRKDGIMLIDNERCIGCRFCMAACPYSTRVFNWSPPKQKELYPDTDFTGPSSPEHAGRPSEMGTVDKCDFCPHMIDKGEVPHCVSSCPNDVFLFGDKYEDTVTNGSGQSYRLSKLLEDNSGYRLLDELGTEPSVYYLPPVDRTDKFEDGLENFKEFESVSKNSENPENTDL